MAGRVKRSLPHGGVRRRAS